MPIPFRDADEVDELGAAGYLKIDVSADSRVVRGGLFLINGRGAPLEFTYNKVETPSSFLWRPQDISRHAARKLATTLLEVCPRVPRFILCRADEVHQELFTNEINLSIPVCRIASSMKATPHSPLEVLGSIEGPEDLHLFWFPQKPTDDSIEHRLLQRLIAGGLVLEPFDRVLIGLREVYDSQAEANR